MLFFKKVKITEPKVLKLVHQLEKFYMEKDLEKVIEMFHPNNRQISFLNEFSLMMTFQTYNIQSEIMNFEIISLSDTEATFTYTRKHMYTCVNKNDENGDNPNNITSFYVQIEVDNNKIFITKYSKYSQLFLNTEGEILQEEQAVVPVNAHFFENMKRFISQFQLDDLKPASYLQWSDSESLGYLPEQERFSYKTTESFTIDYFEEMVASSITEHTETYLHENNLEFGEIIEKKENYSIIETKFLRNSRLLHELVLSMLAPDGFFMIRYLKSNNKPIDQKLRQHWINQMKGATAQT
ncbi:hypothetical protein P4641_21365 [Halalkalibacterium halodurans]|uniref:hypothetical protein n=1 Tax=Halalkalibacterium halodurans TaxID=86665 RepID=UPI002E1E546A|nr:hypothetical protein [Halalkalibacterium halodurans]